jgi:hypothetical protein
MSNARPTIPKSTTCYGIRTRQARAGDVSLAHSRGPDVARDRRAVRRKRRARTADPQPCLPLDGNTTRREDTTPTATRYAGEATGRSQARANACERPPSRLVPADPALGHFRSRVTPVPDPRLSRSLEYGVALLECFTASRPAICGGRRATRSAWDCSMVPARSTSTGSWATAPGSTRPTGFRGWCERSDALHGGRQGIAFDPARQRAPHAAPGYGPRS